jgi:hypothetical protein
VDGDTGANYASHIKFSVSGITGTVQSAVLRVYATSVTKDGPTVYVTTNDWTETDITWNTQPALISSGMDYAGMVRNKTWVEYNVTVQITGNGSYSFVLLPNGTDGVSFSAREGSQSPELVIIFSP